MRLHGAYPSGPCWPPLSPQMVSALGQQRQLRQEVVGEWPGGFQGPVGLG